MGQLLHLSGRLNRVGISNNDQHCTNDGSTLSDSVCRSRDSVRKRGSYSLMGQLDLSGRLNRVGISGNAH